MNPDTIQVSLGTILGAGGSIGAFVMGVLWWLTKAAWKADRGNLELRLTGMNDATRLVRDENTKLRIELTAAVVKNAEQREDLVRHEYRLKALEQGESEHATSLDQMREKMVSKEYLASEFKGQNVTLEHQNRALNEIKIALDRKVSVGSMPAARPGKPPLPRGE